MPGRGEHVLFRDGKRRQRRVAYHFGGGAPRRDAALLSAVRQGRVTCRGHRYCRGDGTSGGAVQTGLVRAGQPGAAAQWFPSPSRANIQGRQCENGLRGRLEACESIQMPEWPFTLEPRFVSCDKFR
jgi:hypothetical protein